MLKPNGILYISFPIGSRDEVHFNAHRIFHPETILKIDVVQEKLKLKRFDYVDDKGDLVLNADVQEVHGADHFGCGIYTFQKPA
jgi:hypothetical protein